MTNSLKPLLCFAHRGGRGHGTENALDTISKSLALGVDGIEIDVWYLGDEILVTHDRQLGRVIKGSGRLVDVPVDQLGSLVHYDGENVARLTDVLELVGDKAVLNIEIKGQNTAEPVAKIVTQFMSKHSVPASRYLISSFDHRQLLWLKNNVRELPRAALVDGIPADLAQCGVTLEAYALNPSLDFLSDELINDAHNKGLKVFVYTVNEEVDFAELSARGVDGLFTDFPEKLLAFNQSLQ